MTKQNISEEADAFCTRIQKFIDGLDTRIRSSLTFGYENDCTSRFIQAAREGLESHHQQLKFWSEASLRDFQYVTCALTPANSPMFWESAKSLCKLLEQKAALDASSCIKEIEILKYFFLKKGRAENADFLIPKLDKILGHAVAIQNAHIAAKGWKLVLQGPPGGHHGFDPKFN